MNKDNENCYLSNKNGKNKAAGEAKMLQDTLLSNDR